MALTHKEMTAHIRTCVKRAGIKANVRMFNRDIQVSAVSYDKPFSSDEHVRIQEIAMHNELFDVRKSPIVLQPIDGKHQVNFEFWG